VSAGVDCAAVLAALARGDALDAAGMDHRASCAGCAALADDVVALGRAFAALPPATPPADLEARLLAAASPLLAANAQAAAAERARAAAAAPAPAAAVEEAWVATPWGEGRLARALVPAILLFPLLVVADVWLLRLVHETLAAILPRPLTTYLVLSYATLLAALGCLVFGAIPLLVERQAALLVWKEEHV
jgi:hypothetical protein